ncbi:MAG TPA: response regulator [Verrucomicrobiae bacterium]|nr:response regulator [Verrucomicrobiae bacterium]
MNNKIRVFVVDDEAPVRQGIGDFLEKRGCEVVPFATNADCLRELETRPASLPQCIVADLRMPFINGADLIARLRGRGQAVPVVIITGLFPEDTLVTRAHAAGAATVLHKPFEPHQLEDAIRRALDMPRETVAVGGTAVLAEVGAYNWW